MKFGGRRQAFRLARRMVLLGSSMFMLAAQDRTPPAYLYTLAPRYEPDAWTRGEERFPAGAAVYLSSGRERRRIAPDLVVSADAFVSYDGTRVLLAGKRATNEPWQIWETSVDGGGLRRITKGGTDCTRPLYLPDGRVVYTRRTADGSVLEAAHSDGGTIERLTFVPGAYLADDVLKDGRILFEVARHESAATKRELFTVYPDGTGVESLRCDHGPDQAEGRQLTSGDVIFRADGQLARIQSAFALQAMVRLPIAGAVGPVAEVGPNSWIFAARDSVARRFSLYRWQESRRRLVSIERAAGANTVQPVIVAARTPPRDFPSALQKSRRTANALCLRVSQSMDPYDGVAQSVRVYSQGQEGSPVVLGQAEVHKDGSFFVQLPGDRPLRFELLDAAGRTLRAERNWIWLRTGEQRICTGCHAGPERAPENRLPDALRLGAEPVVLRGTAAVRP